MKQYMGSAGRFRGIAFRRVGVTARPSWARSRLPCSIMYQSAEGSGRERTLGIVPSRVRDRHPPGRRTLLDRRVVRARRPASAAQGRRRPHRGSCRRADEGSGRARTASDARARQPAGGAGRRAGDDGTGGARVLPAVGAEGPAQVAPADRRLGPAQPHRAVLRRQDARPHPADGHRALRVGEAADARDQDGPQPRQHDALDLRPRSAEGLVRVESGQARRPADGEEDRDAHPVPRPAGARAAARRVLPRRRVRPDRADACI